MESNRNKKVKIVALNPKYRDHSFPSCPRYDDDKRDYVYGIEEAPNSVKQAFHIDSLSRIPVIHNEVLDLSIDKQYGKYLYLKNAVPEVSVSLDKSNEDEHLFYIEDREAEAESNISKQELISIAYTNIEKDKSENKVKDIAYFIGINPRGKSHKQLLSDIYTRAFENPNQINAFFEKSTPNILFVRKCLQHGLIQKNKGSYFDGDVFMGHSELEAAAFVDNPSNSVIVDRLGSILNEKTGYISNVTEQSSQLHSIIIDGEEKMLDRETIVDRLRDDFGWKRYNMSTEKLVEKYHELQDKKAQGE